MDADEQTIPATAPAQTDCKTPRQKAGFLDSRSGADRISVLPAFAAKVLSAGKNFGSNGRQNRNTISIAPAVQKACLLARRFAVGLRRCCCGDCLFIRVTSFHHVSAKSRAIRLFKVQRSYHPYCTGPSPFLQGKLLHSQRRLQKYCGNKRCA